jgi:NitT/TauT family transport system substrate-binding protein
MKRALIPVIAIVAVGLVFAGLYGSRQRPPAPERRGPAEKVVVANVGEFSIYNLVAREKGYFAENGLDAQVDEYDSGGTSVGALQSGKADFAVAADFVGVRRMFADPQIRVVAEVSHHEVFHVIARKDRGITAPSNLKGKKIGLTRKTAGEFYLGRFLTLNGLGIQDVEMVDLPPADMTARFEEGTLDAVVIFDPHAYAILEKMGGAAVSWSAQGGQKAIALVYSTKSFIERRPEIVERYLRALAAAETYVAGNGSGARNLIAQTLRYDNAYLEYMWPRFTFAIELGQDLLLTMEDQARWAMDNGLAERGPIPNYLDFIHFEALEKVRPEAVKIVH